MPILASEAAKYERAQLSADENRTCAAIEAKVDGAIMERFDGGSVTAPFPATGINGKVIAEVARRYARAGWKVTVGGILGPSRIQQPGQDQGEIIAYHFAVAPGDGRETQQKVLDAAVAFVAAAGEETEAALRKAVRAYEGR